MYSRYLDCYYVHTDLQVKKSPGWTFPVVGSVPRAVEENMASVAFPPAMVPVIDRETQHLKPSHLEYFSLWYLMLTLELQSGEHRKGYKNIWMVPSLER